MKIKNKKLSGFTLTELIVVIAFLAILSTIAFTSFTGFSGSARDSSRTSDLASISQSLELTRAKIGSYPDPDNSFPVTYSGGTIWDQGTIGDNVINVLTAGGGIKFSKKPTDPLSTNKEYTYSRLAFGNTFQLKSDWEGDVIAFNEEPEIRDQGLVFNQNTLQELLTSNLWSLTPVSAATGNPTITYIKGNYNGLVAKTKTGGIIYVLSVPSLFVNTSSGAIVLPTTTSTGFYLHGQTNSGGVLFTPSMVFSGTSLPKDNTASGITNFTLAIQKAYSGSSTTLTQNSQVIQDVLSVTGSTNIISLGSAIITNYLGGEANLSSSSTPSSIPGYKITNSLLFDSSKNQYLSKTFTGAGNQKRWTWSGWVKLGNLANNHTLFAARTGVGTSYTVLTIKSDGTFRIEDNNESANPFLKTSAIFRDPSAWYHFVIAMDMTTTERVRVWVNNVLQSTTINAPAQNTNLSINNSSITHLIGQQASGGYLDGYLADVNFVDSGALEPIAFGQFNSTTGQWVPKQYIGNYGTNGFHLDFSSGASLGTDSSGKKNNWTIGTPATMTAADNQVIDTPLNNFSVLNPLAMPPITGGSSYNNTLTHGNLSFLTSDTIPGHFRATVAVDSGKWYWELQNSSGLNQDIHGVALAVINKNAHAFTQAGSVGYNASNGYKYISGIGSSYGASYGAESFIGYALDMDAGTITFYKNGISQGTITLPNPGAYYEPVFEDNSDTMITGATSGNVNFGQKPFAIQSQNPTAWSELQSAGFKTLSTANLPDPIIKNPKQYFDVLTWTGDSNQGRTIPANFTPDFVWTKNRTSAYSGVLTDSVRGGGKALFSDSTSSEMSSTVHGTVTPVTNGINLYGGSSTFGGVNVLNNKYVSWIWKAGGAATSNTDGSIPSQVSANKEAGFSIMTWTGNGVAGASIGHSLNSIPKMVMTKSRNSGAAADHWTVYHGSMDSSIPQNYAMHLDLINARNPAVDYWNNTLPTTSVITYGYNAAYINVVGRNYITYAWSEVPGYSKFGSYTGNGSSTGDGPFVYTGFRPKYVMVKRVDVTEEWMILDSARDVANGAQARLFANSCIAENPFETMDFLSNGFKLRRAGNGTGNVSGGTYIYAAFAEVPFKYANAR